MKTLLAALTLSLSSFAHAAPMAAGEAANLDRFFHALSGRWHGHGTVNDKGNACETRYRFDLEVREGAASTWEVCNDLTTDAGEYKQGAMRFEIVVGGTGEERTEELYVASLPYGAWEPVSIVETSPRTLTYFVRRAEYPSGRVYDLFFHLELDVTGQTLTGLNTIKLNDGVVWREDLTGRR
jgi:hypothetical protein